MQLSKMGLKDFIMAFQLDYDLKGKILWCKTTLKGKILNNIRN